MEISPADYVKKYLVKNLNEIIEYNIIKENPTRTENLKTIMDMIKKLKTAIRIRKEIKKC